MASYASFPCSRGSGDAGGGRSRAAPHGSGSALAAAAVWCADVRSKDLLPVVFSFLRLSSVGVLGLVGRGSRDTHPAGVVWPVGSLVSLSARGSRGLRDALFATSSEKIPSLLASLSSV